MKLILAAAAGGAVGATARYGLYLWTLKTYGATVPMAALLANLIGCFAAGLIAPSVVDRGVVGDGLRVFVMVGILGGFTTFSAFALDILALLRDGRLVAAGLFVGANVIGGLALVLLGAAIGLAAAR